MEKNTVTHVEWGTTQLTLLKDFMAGLFGWPFQQFDEDYFMYSAPAGLSVGLMRSDHVQVGGGTPNVYIDVVSIEACLEKAKALGGDVAVPKTAIQGMGSFAFVKAPDGNLIGLFETGQ